MINKRIMKIVEVLLTNKEYITIDMISEQLNVSNKTIRNDLQLVDEWLLENQLKLIKKTGVGIRIEGEKTDKLRISKIVSEKNKSMIDYSPEARKIFIGMQLITCVDSCRIYELSSSLFVSRATIHKDILALSKSLDEYKIKLNRKNNNGISIEGKERNLRNFLLELMMNDNGYGLFVDIIKNDQYPCDGSYVFAGLEVTDDEVKDFFSCILGANHPYLNSLFFHSLVTVLLHFFLAILRIQDHHYVTLSQPFIQELENEPFYEEAKQLTQLLATHYKITIPDTEVRYLQVYMISLKNSNALNNDDKKEAMDITESMIDDFSQQLHLPFIEDTTLKHALFTHLCPAITRFRHNIPVENPLMNDIKNLYSHTFDIAKNSAKSIYEKYNYHLSDDEIGYIALHLAASLERMKRPLNCIVVCHGGMGASNLLVEKLTSQIVELKIVSQETFFSIDGCDFQNIDLIISTMKLQLNTEIPVLEINSILHDYDITRIKDIVNEYYKIKNDPLIK